MRGVHCGKAGPSASSGTGSPDVSELSAEGLTAAEIAARTSLSVHTVNTHRQHIYAKMCVKNVADMLRKAGELEIL